MLPEVLVARDRAHLEAFDRIGDAWGGYRVLDGFDATLELPAVGAALTLRDIYRRLITD